MTTVSGSGRADFRPLEEGLTEALRTSWPLRALRIVAWSWLVVGLVGAAVVWLNARETVSITRTITSHARLTF